MPTTFYSSDYLDGSLSVSSALKGDSRSKFTPFSNLRKTMKKWKGRLFTPSPKSPPPPSFNVRWSTDKDEFIPFDETLNTPSEFASIEEVASANLPLRARFPTWRRCKFESRRHVWPIARFFKKNFHFSSNKSRRHQNSANDDKFTPPCADRSFNVKLAETPTISPLPTDTSFTTSNLPKWISIVDILETQRSDWTTRKNYEHCNVEIDIRIMVPSLQRIVSIPKNTKLRIILLQPTEEEEKLVMAWINCLSCYVLRKYKSLEKLQLDLREVVSRCRKLQKLEGSENDPGWIPFHQVLWEWSKISGVEIIISRYGYGLGHEGLQAFLCDTPFNPPPPPPPPVLEVDLSVPFVFHNSPATHSTTTTSGSRNRRGRSSGTPTSWTGPAAYPPPTSTFIPPFASSTFTFGAPTLAPLFGAGEAPLFPELRSSPLSTTSRRPNASDFFDDTPSPTMCTPSFKPPSFNFGSPIPPTASSAPPTVFSFDVPAPATSTPLFGTTRTTQGNFSPSSSTTTFTLSGVQVTSPITTSQSDYPTSCAAEVSEEVPESPTSASEGSIISHEDAEY